MQPRLSSLVQCKRKHLRLWSITGAWGAGVTAGRARSDAAFGVAVQACKHPLPELGVVFLSLCLRCPDGPFLHECV